MGGYLVSQPYHVAAMGQAMGVDSKPPPINTRLSVHDTRPPECNLTHGLLYR